MIGNDAGEMLANCPFCNASVSRWNYDGVSLYRQAAGGEWQVFCEQCGAETSSKPDRADAITAWNTRTTPASAGVLVEVDEQGEAKVCAGCGTTRSIAGIKAVSSTAFSCCPERKMIPVRQALSTTATPASDGVLDRPALLAAAHAWWAANMPDSNCRNVVIKGDGRVDVYWSDKDEDGKYTLPVNFAATPDRFGEGSAVHPSLELCVQFSDDGQHIRKWSRLPFEGGECLYSHLRSVDLAKFVETVAGMEGDELEAHASVELRDAARDLCKPTPDRFGEGYRAGVEAAKPQCPCCGLTDISLHMTCHNSSCGEYASEVTIYEGWQGPDITTAIRALQPDAGEGA